MEKYKFRKYDPQFQELFRREKIKLKKILPNDSKIEHIGSTAVIGLGGKGIIDILIGVNKKDFQKIKKILQEKKYLFPKGGNKNRLFAEKDYKYRNKARRVHLQIVHKNSIGWRKALKVRDSLIKNNGYAKAYSKLKKEAVKICEGEGKRYRDYKKNFLTNLSK